jgi:uncharacterized protein (TIGR02996 family)
MNTSWDEGTAFLRAIGANPADDAPRLVYADWLREQGHDLLADFISEDIRGGRMTAKAGRLLDRILPGFVASLRSSGLSVSRYKRLGRRVDLYFDLGARRTVRGDLVWLEWQRGFVAMAFVRPFREIFGPLAPVIASSAPAVQFEVPLRSLGFEWHGNPGPLPPSETTLFAVPDEFIPHSAGYVFCPERHLPAGSLEHLARQPGATRGCTQGVTGVRVDRRPGETDVGFVIRLNSLFNAGLTAWADDPRSKPQVHGSDVTLASSSPESGATPLFG